MSVKGKLALGLIGAVAVGGLFLAERMRPLRRQTRAPAPRLARNAALGALCQTMIAAYETPLTGSIAQRNRRKSRGLQGALPGPAGALAGFLAMDYGFYLWHVATHKVPFLWRFHRVHHVDAELDMSTAIRFHFIDMLVSLPWRLVQVRVSGVGPRELAIWRAFFFGSILFHHSNLRLPNGWDRRLATFLTTPRMHGIHHSQRRSEMDSNWSSGIAFWDHLHGTFRDTPPQCAIPIGVDDAEAERDIALAAALEAPFRTQPARRSGERKDYSHQ